MLGTSHGASWTAAAWRVLGVTAGAFGVSAVVAAPTHADMMGNAFLTALNNAGIPYSQPASTMALGRSVCPMVVERNRTFEFITAEMAEQTGMARDMAASFTIVAIATYCPAVIAPLMPHRLQA
ncbi:hypothetical protein A5725_18285 [Mycobacterium kubicae]|nr:hypothetical protein A5725_18285 [Mycobacterium kubicae]OBK53549.1 hypothetical protein A5657_01190 [Mycobacterium kubicae]